MKTDDAYMVFDVESIGLHGIAFAVAYVVINGQGKTLEENLFSCDPDSCGGMLEDRLWVQENIPPLQITHEDAKGVRDAFWSKWCIWKVHGTILVADCPWPVEAKFLEACVQDNPAQRNWEGPYPLLDVASVQIAKGQDFKTSTPRLPSELPVHHPLMDSRQSARQLIELLKE